MNIEELIKSFLCSNNNSNDKFDKTKLRNYLNTLRNQDEELDLIGSAAVLHDHWEFVLEIIKFRESRKFNEIDYIGRNYAYTKAIEHQNNKLIDKLMEHVSHCYNPHLLTIQLEGYIVAGNQDAFEFMYYNVLKLTAENPLAKASLLAATTSTANNILKFLLMCKVPISIKNVNGLDPLDLAISKFNWHGAALETINILLDTGASLEVSDNTSGSKVEKLYVYLSQIKSNNEFKKRYSAELYKLFMHCIHQDCARLFHLLVSLDAFDLTEPSGKNEPIDKAIKWDVKDSSIIQTLINAQAQSSGYTCLHYLMDLKSQTHQDINTQLDCYLDHGADPSILDKKGFSVIDVSVKEGWYDLFAKFIEKQLRLQAKLGITHLPSFAMPSISKSVILDKIKELTNDQQITQALLTIDAGLDQDNYEKALELAKQKILTMDDKQRPVYKEVLRSTELKVLTEKCKKELQQKDKQPLDFNHDMGHFHGLIVSIFNRFGVANLPISDLATYCLKEDNDKKFLLQDAIKSITGENEFFKTAKEANDLVETLNSAKESTILSEKTLSQSLNNLLRKTECLSIIPDKIKQLVRLLVSGLQLVEEINTNDSEKMIVAMGDVIKHTDALAKLFNTSLSSLIQGLGGNHKIWGPITKIIPVLLEAIELFSEYSHDRYINAKFQPYFTKVITSVLHWLHDNLQKNNEDNALQDYIKQACQFLKLSINAPIYLQQAYNAYRETNGKDEKACYPKILEILKQLCEGFKPKIVLSNEDYEKLIQKYLNLPEDIANLENMPLKPLLPILIDIGKTHNETGLLAIAYTMQEYYNSLEIVEGNKYSSKSILLLCARILSNVIVGYIDKHEKTLGKKALVESGEFIILLLYDIAKLNKKQSALKQIGCLAECMSENWRLMYRLDKSQLLVRLGGIIKLSLNIIEHGFVYQPGLDIIKQGNCDKVALGKDIRKLAAKLELAPFGNLLNAAFIVYDYQHSLGINLDKGLDGLHITLNCTSLAFKRFALISNRKDKGIIQTCLWSSLATRLIGALYAQRKQQNAALLNYISLTKTTLKTFSTEIKSDFKEYKEIFNTIDSVAKVLSVSEVAGIVYDQLFSKKIAPFVENIRTLMQGDINTNKELGGLLIGGFEALLKGDSKGLENFATQLASNPVASNAAMNLLKSVGSQLVKVGSSGALLVTPAGAAVFAIGAMIGVSTYFINKNLNQIKEQIAELKAGQELIINNLEIINNNLMHLGRYLSTQLVKLSQQQAEYHQQSMQYMHGIKIMMAGGFKDVLIGIKQLNATQRYTLELLNQMHNEMNEQFKALNIKMDKTTYQKKKESNEKLWKSIDYFIIHYQEEMFEKILDDLNTLVRNSRQDTLSGKGFYEEDNKVSKLFFINEPERFYHLGFLHVICKKDLKCDYKLKFDNEEGFGLVNLTWWFKAIDLLMHLREKAVLTGKENKILSIIQPGLEALCFMEWLAEEERLRAIFNYFEQNFKTQPEYASCVLLTYMQVIGLSLKPYNLPVFDEIWSGKITDHRHYEEMIKILVNITKDYKGEYPLVNQLQIEIKKRLLMLGQFCTGILQDPNRPKSLDEPFQKAVEIVVSGRIESLMLKTPRISHPSSELETRMKSGKEEVIFNESQNPTSVGSQSGFFSSMKYSDTAEEEECEEDYSPRA